MAAIQEGHGLNYMSYDDLRGNLIAYETTFLNKLNNEKTNKRGIALKATTSTNQEEEDDEGGHISRDE